MEEEPLLSDQNKKAGSTFFGGAAVLAAGVIIVKIIGVLYKIPLGNVLTNESFADFSTAYNIYTLLLTVSTAGLPVALSKTVSEANALGRRNQVHKIFKVGVFTFFTLGLISAVIMSVFADPLTRAMSNPNALLCVRVLAPSALFVCCMSSLRGYAQGHSNMKPTAISQIIEALCKLAVGLGLAVLLLRWGYGQNAAAGAAIFGVTVGTFLSLVYLIFDHIITRRREPGGYTDKPLAGKSILKKLVLIAIPITLGSSVVSLVTLIDNKIVLSQLREMFLMQGMLPDFEAGLDPALDAARNLYGIYQKTMSLYNLPSSLMVPITASVIPAVAAFRARKDERGAGRIAESSLRMTAILACPAGVGLCVLSQPILALLYSTVSHGLTDEEVAIAAPLLSVLGIAAIFVCIMLVCNSILQASGRLYLPILTMAVGSVAKVVVNYVLVRNPVVNINGAPIGTLVCFALVAVLDLILIAKTMPAAPNFARVFAKPVLASVIMGAAAWGCYGLLHRFFGVLLATAGTIVIAMVIYFVLVVALRMISKDDLALMPKGEKIGKILRL